MSRGAYPLFAGQDRTPPLGGVRCPAGSGDALPVPEAEGARRISREPVAGSMWANEARNLPLSCRRHRTPKNEQRSLCNLNEKHRQQCIYRRPTGAAVVSRRSNQRCIAMWNENERQRYLANGYRELWHDGNLIMVKPDDRTPIRRRLGIFGDDVLPTMHALRVAVAEAGLAGAALERMFVMGLFARSNTRRFNEGPKGLAVEAARLIVPVCLSNLERLAQKEGLRVITSGNAHETLALEMVGAFLQSEPVRRMVRDQLWRDRAEMFADEKLTCGDPNITIRVDNELYKKVEHELGQECVSPELGTETVVRTISRTLDYIEHIRHLPDARRFFNLRRLLTAQWRVGQAVLGHDF